MEIGRRCIVRRKRSVLYEVSVLRDFAHILAAQEIRLRFSSHVGRANLFRVDVINAAIGMVERTILVGLFIVVPLGALSGDRRCRFIAVDPHVASQFHLMCGRIVLRVIGVDVCVAHVNGDVVPRCGHPVFIRSLPG